MTTLPEEWAEDDNQSELVPLDEAWAETTGHLLRMLRETKQAEREAAQFAGWNTYTIGQAGTISAPPYVTQILQRCYRRYKAKFGPCTFGTGCTAVWFNNDPSKLLSSPTVPNGWQMSTTGLVLPDYDAQQPLYAIAIGGIATLPALDESYGNERVG